MQTFSPMRLVSATMEPVACQERHVRGLELQESIPTQHFLQLHVLDHMALLLMVAITLEDSPT